MTITKVSLVVAAVGVVAAVTFGILELKAESDYDKEVKPMAMDDIAKKGRNYAILTNVGIVTAAVGLVAAGIAGYPLVLGRARSQDGVHLHAGRDAPGRRRRADRPLLGVPGPDPHPNPLPASRERGPDLLPLPLAGEGRGEGRPCESEGRSHGAATCPASPCRSRASRRGA